MDAPDVLAQDADHEELHGGEQRERRGELAGEVVDAEVGAVGTELLGRETAIQKVTWGEDGWPRLDDEAGLALAEVPLSRFLADERLLATIGKHIVVDDRLVMPIG